MGCSRKRSSSRGREGGRGTKVETPSASSFITASIPDVLICKIYSFLFLSSSHALDPPIPSTSRADPSFPSSLSFLFRRLQQHRSPLLNRSSHSRNLKLIYRSLTRRRRRRTQRRSVRLVHLGSQPSPLSPFQSSSSTFLPFSSSLLVVFLTFAAPPNPTDRFQPTAKVNPSSQPVLTTPPQPNPSKEDRSTEGKPCRPLSWRRQSWLRCLFWELSESRNFWLSYDGVRAGRKEEGRRPLREIVADSSFPPFVLFCSSQLETIGAS